MKDARIEWVLKGCADRWPAELGLVATTLPADYVAAGAGRTARALVFENESAAAWRAKRAFESQPRG